MSTTDTGAPRRGLASPTLHRDAPATKLQHADGEGAATRRYHWVALSNTTLGMLMATINGSIVMISLPAIFSGIGLDPLTSSNVNYLLWMLMGYTVVSAVFVVPFGRLGDMFGRVRIYTLGFAVFTAASVLLAIDPFTGATGGQWLIGWRIVQGVGGAMIFANSTAILTDAFPPNRRGMAMGFNQVAAIAGGFIGLVVGGILSVIDWRAIFFVSVPVGLVGTIWSARSLKEMGRRNPGHFDVAGNLAFGVGLTLVLVGVTYGIQPYGRHSTGWTNPWVLAAMLGGATVLALFAWIELHIDQPMFDLRLFRIRAFSMGNLASLLSSTGRGGLQFMLIIWLQGIWLPLRGYSFESTPLWAGIYMLPLSIGFLVAGPLSGTLSDRFGARAFATGGLAIVCATFVALIRMPVDFNYWEFGLVTFLSGVGSGMFGAPNRTAIMNSVPADQRGSASGMAGMLQNAGTSLSTGIFFSLMITGFASGLPQALTRGLVSNGVPQAVAAHIGSASPVGLLFAAFLGYNPIQTLLDQAHVTAQIDPGSLATLTGHSFFPQLISGSFHNGLAVVFTVATVMTAVAAAASLVRGQRFVNDAVSIRDILEDDAVEVGGDPLPIGAEGAAQR